MNFKEATLLAKTDGSFIEGFVKCTYVQLFNAQGRQLFTIRRSYSSLYGVTFRRKENGGFGKVPVVPICRAYDFEKVRGLVPVVPSNELKYAIKQLIFNSTKTPDTWKLIRRWTKNYPPDHKQGDMEVIAETRKKPEYTALKSGNVVETACYVEYWKAPQYDYVLDDKYLQLLDILEKNDKLYVKDVAVDWYPDIFVVTTIEDDILTDEYGRLITDENGDPVVLYDENGNAIHTDANGKPIYPEEYETVVGTAAVEAAKKKLDRAKTILAAAGAISII